MNKNGWQIFSILDKYLKYLRFSKSYSSLTIKAYKTDLEQFFGYKKTKFDVLNSKKRPVLKKMNKNTHLKTQKKLEIFLKNKINKNLNQWGRWSPATRNRKMATLKSFFKWLYWNHHISEDLNVKLKSPKVPSRIPHFLSVDEVQTLIQTLFQYQKKEEVFKKDFVLILMLYGGGLRVSEACAIKWSHLNFVEKTLKVKGKGSKERIVVLPDVVFQHLRSLNKTGPYIFGKKVLGSRQAYSIVRKWGAKSGLKKPISPHVLRHSYATHLLDSGSDLRVLQDLLGHRSLSATQKYTQIRLSKLSRTLKSYHPLIKNHQK